MIAHAYLDKLDLLPVLNPHSASRAAATAPSASQAKMFTSASGRADGSSGYGDVTLSTVPHTAATAPQAWAGKFRYYFNALPPELQAVLRMDEVASFSVTEANFADRISRLVRALPGLSANPRIVDATACVGGNSMSFLHYFDTVWSVELDTVRAQMLFKNLKNCKKILETKNPGKKLGDFKVFPGNFLELCAKPEHQLSRHSDVVFLDPPWGGRKYKDSESVRLLLGGMAMCDVSNSLRDMCQYVVMKLPVNYDVEALRGGVLKVGGQLIEDKDLADGRGRKKMKIVVVSYGRGSGGGSNSRGNHSSGFAFSEVNAKDGGRTAASNNAAHQSSRLSPSSAHALEIPITRILSPENNEQVPPHWNDPAAQKIFKETSGTPQVRGIYAREDEPSQAWRSVSAGFPNPGVPRFKSKRECVAWTKFVRGTPSNPDGEQGTHAAHIHNACRMGPS